MLRASGSSWWIRRPQAWVSVQSWLTSVCGLRERWGTQRSHYGPTVCWRQHATSMRKPASPLPRASRDRVGAKMSSRSFGISTYSEPKNQAVAPLAFGLENARRASAESPRNCMAGNGSRADAPRFRPRRPCRRPVNPEDRKYKSRWQHRRWPRLDRRRTDFPFTHKQKHGGKAVHAFFNSGSTASGVTSRPVNPVPPVVMMTSIRPSAIQALTWSRIALTSDP